MDWLANLTEWTNDHSGLIALIGVILPLAFAYVIGARARAGVPSLGEVLKDRDSWPELITRWRRGSAQAYADAVARVLRLAERVYGPRALSSRAFLTCLGIAYVYPIVAVFFGWVATNTHDPGGVLLFISEPKFSVRLAHALAAIGGFAITSWGLVNFERNIDSILHYLLVLFANQTSQCELWPKVAWTLAGLLSISITFLFLAVGSAVAGLAVFFTLAGGNDLDSVLAASFPVSLAIVIAASFSGGGPRAAPATVAAAIFATFAVALAVFGAVAAVLGGNPAYTETTALLLLFYALLPVLNAVADWLSFAITRRFLAPMAAAATDPANRPPLPMILLRTAVDLILALACLAGLLAAIVGGLEFWAHVSPATLPFTWQGYWAEVAADPARGIALYLMIATTLLPTVIHLIAGLGGVFTYRAHVLTREADILSARLESGEALSAIDRRDMVLRVRRAGFVGFGFATLCTGAILAVIAWVVWLALF